MIGHWINWLESFFPEISNFITLKLINFSCNSFLQGSLLCNIRNLNSFHVFRDNITGIIPISHNLTQTHNLNISVNNFEGMIPTGAIFWKLPYSAGQLTWVFLEYKFALQRGIGFICIFSFICLGHSWNSILIYTIWGQNSHSLKELYTLRRLKLSRNQNLNRCLIPHEYIYIY